MKYQWCNSCERYHPPYTAECPYQKQEVYQIPEIDASTTINGSTIGWMLDQVRKQNQRIGELESKFGTGGMKNKVKEEFKRVDYILDVHSKRIDELEKTIVFQGRQIIEWKNKLESHFTGELQNDGKPTAKAYPEGLEGHTCYLGAGNEKCPECNPEPSVSEDKVLPTDRTSLATLFPLNWREYGLIELCDYICTEMKIKEAKND